MLALCPIHGVKHEFLRPLKQDNIFHDEACPGTPATRVGDVHVPGTSAPFTSSRRTPSPVRRHPNVEVVDPGERHVDGVLHPFARLGPAHGAAVVGKTPEHDSMSTPSLRPVQPLFQAVKGSVADVVRGVHLVHVGHPSTPKS